MASSSISFSCAPSLATSLFSTTSSSSSSSSSPRLFSSRFLGTRKVKLQIRPARLGLSNGSRTTCWFKFGKNRVVAKNAGIYGSQSRDDFDRDDVEQYFNYMGMLAVEGTYSKMEALVNLNIHPAFKMGSVICNKHNDESEHSESIFICMSWYMIKARLRSLSLPEQQRKIHKKSILVRVNEEFLEVVPRHLVSHYHIFSTSSYINPKITN